jgi:phosphohistidine swiveling domain-containing protein
MNNPKIDLLTPKNYIRAFSFKNLGYIFSDITLSWYKRRDFLIIYQDGVFCSYIGSKAYEKALEEGKEIFSKDTYFKTFEDGFRKVIEEMTEYLSKSTEIKSVTISDFIDLRNLTNKAFYYFEKTEFFFTDLCYNGEMDAELKRNLFILGDDLKVKARPLLVQLITTIPYRFIDLVSKEKDINSGDLRAYSFDEIISFLEKGDKIKEDILSDRKKSFVVYSERGSRITLYAEEKNEVLKKFKKDIDYLNTTEFKGTTASRGRILSRAHVIIPELDQDYNLFVEKLNSIRFNEKDILVTETTSPDFFLLMQKAGGVIANQGGMNSHAAIVCRELGIPCLVGAEIATELLKTGDLIELDADNGIVRIIERVRK